MRIGIGIGLSHTVLSSGGGGFSPTDEDAIAYIASLSTEPSSADQQRIDALFVSLKAGGIFAGLDALYLMDRDIEADAKINAAAPGTFDLTAGGTLAFTARKGFKGNGTTGYLATGYTPDGTRNYKLNSASVGVWVDEATKEATWQVGTTVTGTRCLLNSWDANSNGRLSSRMNDVGALQATVPEGTGLAVASRTAADSKKIYWKGALRAALTTASTSLPTEIAYLRANTTYSTSRVSIGFIGRGYTDAEVALLHRAFSAYAAAGDLITEDFHLWPTAAGTWFNDPRAIAYGDDRVLTGGIHPYDGTQVANIIGGGHAGQSMILSTAFEKDDHNNPAFLHEAVTGKYMAWFARHNGAGLFQSTSVRADDPTEWGATVDIDTGLGASNYAYANVYQLTDGADRPIVLFTRCITGVELPTMAYSVSEDSGATWATAIRVVTGDRPYWRQAQNGLNRIDFITNDAHPVEDTTNSTYHYYMEINGGTVSFHSTDGTPLTLPITPSTDLDLVWDGSTVAGRSWVWNVEAIGGSPVAVFAVFPTTTDHRYRRGVLNGGAWETEEICAAGGYLYEAEVYYSGGVCIDPENADIAYCSRQVDENGNIDTAGVHQLFKYIKSGGVWTGEQLTFGDEPSIRPWIVRGKRLLHYYSGAYTSYTDFDLQAKLIEID